MFGSVPTLTLFDLAAGLLTLSAAFAWLNYKVFRLPSTIGVLVMGLAASLVLIAFEFLVTHTELYTALTDAIKQIDFTAAVMNGMLAFLLFAGALHVDFERLKSRAWSVGFMATLGVVISTLIVGFGIWLIAGALGLAIPLPWAFVFGALISPTDPVAVLATLKNANLPQTLETELAGEALFNDGVGIVLFTILVAAASSAGASGHELGIAQIGQLFFLEAIGGVVLGLMTGYIAYRAMAALDEFVVEILISLALVMGTYALAGKLHVSGPIAVVAAGLLIGERGVTHAMSKTTEQHLFAFWTLIDEILNAVLFLLIGLEVLVVRFDLSFAPLALASVPLVLMARFFAVATPVMLLDFRMHFMRGTIPILTWSGVRGGISVALALSLPESEAKAPILAATYAVVLFTLIVQGLTLGPAVKRILREQ